MLKYFKSRRCEIPDSEKAKKSSLSARAVATLLSGSPDLFWIKREATGAER